MSEEKKVIGKIESVEEVPKQNGGVFYKVKLGGRTYSTFNDPRQHSGKIVELIYVEKENPAYPDNPYKNIISAKEIDEQPDVLTEEKPMQPTRTEIDIHRQVFLKVASIQLKNTTPTKLFEYAKQLEKEYDNWGK